MRRRIVSYWWCTRCELTVSTSTSQFVVALNCPMCGKTLDACTNKQESHRDITIEYEPNEEIEAARS